MQLNEYVVFCCVLLKANEYVCMVLSKGILWKKLKKNIGVVTKYIPTSRDRAPLMLYKVLPKNKITQVKWKKMTTKIYEFFFFCSFHYFYSINFSDFLLWIRLWFTRITCIALTNWVRLTICLFLHQSSWLPYHTAVVIASVIFNQFDQVSNTVHNFLKRIYLKGTITYSYSYETHQTAQRQWVALG